MPNYCVNIHAQSDSGDHEVHDLASTKNCLPDAKNQLALGWFSDCKDAVREAKKHYSDVNGCASCATDCHTS